jgi:peroxiredoxin
MPAIQVGEVAPDFELPAVVGDKRQKFKLSELRGKNVVLAFYVLNWTPT